MKNLILTATVLFIFSVGTAQKINEKIDRIFNAWNEENHPGGVVLVSQKNEVIYLKAFGQSNTKYKIPNTTQTVFNIGSVSKQFTAMGIVILQQAGMLSFDDDIRDYLPELYPFETEVTIRHLLHHTSGFRSSPEFFALAGWRDGDPISTHDDYRFLCKQTALNFTPGSQFMYSNSGYILLAKIIEKVTQQKFNDWMKTNVFDPLKLSNTYVDETNTKANSLVATPYHEIEKQKFIIGENTSLDIGASNIYSTAEDLNQWMQNFIIPTPGWKNAFETLLTTDSLSNGDPNTYAFGIVKDVFYGNPRIQHSGAIPGFLSYASYYPDQDLTIVLVSNLSSRSVDQKHTTLTQLFLKNNSPKVKKPKPVKELPLNLEMAKKVVGDYWNEKDNYSRKIYLENDTLWYMRDNGRKSPLIQTGTNSYVLGGINARVIVEFSLNQTKKMFVTDGNSPTILFSEYNSTPLSETELRTYTGKFYSPELETTYTISYVNNQLWGYHHRHGEFPIQVLKKDVTDWSGFAVTTYMRNKKNEITGFYVSLNRVKNVWFQKQ